MNPRFERSALVIGRDALETLKNSHVTVFGLGGVGGYVCEALARAGIGRLTLVDFDEVDITNLNRQIIALTSTLGKTKTELMAARLLDINPELQLRLESRWVTPDNVAEFLDGPVDYVVDAIDKMGAKLAIAVYCHEQGIPLISSMGTGNKLDPTRVEVMDIYRTSGDPMARIMRKELRKRGVSALKVVCSTEQPIRHEEEYGMIDNPRRPGSMMFVPATAGITLASVVVADILENHLL